MAMEDRLTCVFGGTGFLGRAVVRQLAGEGRRVCVVARHPDRADFVGLDQTQLQRRSADLADPASVAAALEGAQAVVNAVSLYVETTDLSFDAVHVEGAAQVARLSREAGVETLVHVSGIGADTQSPSPLVRAKAHGERRVSETFPGAHIVRPSVLFGRDDAFLSNLEMATRMPVVPLFGTGEVKMQPAWVQDVAKAIARLAAGAKTDHQALEFGGAETLTYRRALEVVCERLGRKRVFLPFPMIGWKLLVHAMSVLPNPPLTIDQLALLVRDNTVAPDRDGFAKLGMQSKGMTELLEECLSPLTSRDGQ